MTDRLQRRLTVLWNRERLDRPCIAVRAPRTEENLTPVSEPANDEVRWLDPDSRVALGRRELKSTWWGGDAKQHSPRLLSLPYLRVIQYVPAPFEPPNGPGHLEMYKQIQAAGRIVHIQVPVQNVEPLVRELDPALLMLDTWCASRAEGERLLEQAVAWAQQAPRTGEGG